MEFPILIPRKMWNDLNHAKNQEWQGLLDIEFFQLFPLEYLGSHLGVVDLDEEVFDK